MKKFKYNFLYIALLFFTAEFSVSIMAQNGGVYIDPNRGEKIFRKTNVMDANQVESIFGNWGMFGKRDDKQSGVWPKGTTHGHVHEMTTVVAAEVVGRDGKTYHIVDDSYSEFSDESPSRLQYWWNPLSGYANNYRRFVKPDGTVDTTSKIAVSIDSTTWPDCWPGKSLDWCGKWNGYFGQSESNRPDNEAVYVMDDLYNSEFPYYPIATDSTKRGLGMQVETRLFQWKHALAENQVFIHYQVTNISDNSYGIPYGAPIYLGAYADTHPGGLGSTNDVDDYSIPDNMVIAWAYNNKGIWTKYPDILPGYMGWKYLESPGIGDDNIDNDNDGIQDEKRDNDAGTMYEGTEVIKNALRGQPGFNMSSFLNYFGYKSEDEIPAVKSGVWWTGDENANWNPTTDDVGTDGVGPNDFGYEKPDADGTEGNGRPDNNINGCEPNFARTDKDESDQIGLTSFYSPAYGVLQPKDDEAIWSNIQPGTFQTPAQNANNLWVFASGSFNLTPKKTERFSVVWLFGPDRTALELNAKTSQTIYNNSYRFTKPPLQPTVQAIPGNKQVTLYWDNIAERSWDPIYGNDFEGYRIYRSTDPQFSDAHTITNAYGSYTYYKPYAVFDVIDSVRGLHPVALGEEWGPDRSTGIHYYLGDDSGLRYFFKDTSVINGMTYYYAVVSYDKGYYTGMDDRNLGQMSPAECPFQITYTNGELSAVSKNLAIAIPNAAASDYNPGHTDADENGGYLTGSDGSTSTGKIKVDILNPDILPENNKFAVSFKDSINAYGAKQTISYSIKNESNGEVFYSDVKIPKDANGYPSNQWVSPVFKGMVLNFQNAKPEIDTVEKYSGWSSESKTNLNFSLRPVNTNNLVPINFTVEVTADPSQRPFGKPTQMYFRIYDSNTLDTVQFSFTENLNKDNKINAADIVTILVDSNDPAKKIQAWKIVFSNPLDSLTEPQPGDKFNFVCGIPFGSNDVYSFNTVATKMKAMKESELDQVAVVPNPYVAAAKWERQTDITGRGIRKIDFIHLPAECTIRIFTQNGYLVKTLQHQGVASNGTESWDLTTDEGLEVAFGIYIFHIEAAGIGEKIGTFAIIN
ncbi:MAG: hypothetical protein C4539_11030 [Ignavibacteriales bacterium]|nr:MAG: hypothetical protein C4539_11030 [Ignavibacteriales bacterium]